MSKMTSWTMLLIGGIMLFSCSGSTRITGSWKNPDIPPAARDYKSVFIAALVRNMEVRTKLENAMAAQASIRDIKAYKSTDYLAPRFQEKQPDREEMIGKIRGTGAQTILSVSLLDKRSETRYVRGNPGYAPVPAYGWYRGFYAYYTHWYPRIYDPGYYVTDRTYFLEANLYDASDEKLLWSAQSETVNPSGIDQFVQEYPQKLVEQMIRDGLLQK